MSQLRDLLASIRGATFCSFHALTTPEGRKTPLGQLKKLVKVSAITGAYYERALQKATGQQADERPWGQHDQSCLVEKVHPESGAKNYYLPVQNPRYGRPLYLARNESGKLQMVPTEQAKPFLRQRPESAVTYRDFRLDHITSIAIGGRRYRIRQEERA